MTMQFFKRITISIYKENEKWDECFISLDKRVCEAFLEGALN